MRRTRLLIVLGLLAASPAAAYAENWFGARWSGWRRDYRENILWPEQYLDHDRAAVRAPFSAMVANGWRSQNTISNYHFNEASGELNDTGRIKIKSVMTQTPPEFRSLYVLRGESPAITAARVRAVQDHSARIAQGDELPAVMITTIEPPGMSGEIVNGVSVRQKESAVAPVLPAVQRTTE